MSNPTPPHHCHAIGCETACRPEMLMCPRHWKMVPRAFQRAVWAAYRVGQCQDKRPSRAWQVAAWGAIYSVAVGEGRMQGDEAVQRYREIVSRINSERSEDSTMRKISTEAAAGQEELLGQLTKYREETEKRFSDAAAIAGRLRQQLDRIDREIASVTYILEMWRDQDIPDPKEKPTLIGGLPESIVALESASQVTQPNPPGKKKGR